jgi:hypothetical protein
MIRCLLAYFNGYSAWNSLAPGDGKQKYPSSLFTHEKLEYCPGLPPVTVPVFSSLLFGRNLVRNIATDIKIFIGSNFAA